MGHRKRGRGRVGGRYGGGGVGDHTSPISLLYPENRVERRRLRDQVPQRYIWSQDSHYRHRRRSYASHLLQEGRRETIICI